MTAIEAPLKKTDWPAMLRKVRLGTGFVLFFYVTTHLLNLMLGLISLDVLDQGGRVFTAFWRFPVISLVLYAAFILHAGLGLWALVERRSLRMPWRDAGLILLGLSIPILLSGHIMATRGAHELLGVDDTYTYEMLALWVFFPSFGISQSIAVIVIWTHGVLGLNAWMRLRPWYPAWRPWLAPVALLWPAVSLAGYVAAGREVLLRAADQGWVDGAATASNLTPEKVGFIVANLNVISSVFVVLYAVVLVWHGVRFLSRNRVARVRVGYPDGRTVVVPTGASVLEASRMGGIPHASVCGGRGRCSTCRVRVLSSSAALPPPEAEEARVLSRIDAEPSMRLACQLHPAGDLSVLPLLAANSGPSDAGRPGYLQGAEREIAVLFADLRAFTAVAESKLPYDVVFLLNQYFKVMGEAVEAAGGRLDKFIGDGVMALFGVRQGVRAGSLNAMHAAQQMALALDRMNRELAHDLDEPLRMGIGIHAGPAIVGEMGYRDVSSVTAVGDTVNAASRLEALTKEFGCQLVVSRHVVDMAGVDPAQFDTRQAEVRGRAETLEVLLATDAARLTLPARFHRPG
jgi:adenylate cyclase